MPPLRTMPTIKPMKTERSHEENQERAYIAASRRSDRSLEARVESARRASEIHEKRTGRKLRVTEQDVINEEMYEEEDDNIPWRYRHLALLPNLSTLSPEFRRRVEAQLVLEMERSRMVDPNAQFQSPGPYLNPGLMQMGQMGQMGQQSPMFPPSMFQFGQQTSPLSPQMPLYPQLSPGLPAQQQSHRHSPYPTNEEEQRRMRPGSHQRSASIANPQELSAQRQHQRQSTRTPTEAAHMEDRRMSLPPQTGSGEKVRSPNQPKRPALSRSGSGQTTASQHSHTTSSSQMPSPEIQRHNTYSGPYHNASHSAQSSTNPYAPLTPTLPMNTQQLLGDGMFGFPDDNKFPTKPSAFGLTQPLYNYNPNANSKSSKKRTHDQITSTSGLDQTLMPTALDTSFGDSNRSAMFGGPPHSANTELLDSAAADPSYDFAGAFGEGEFGSMDLFNTSSSSRQESPAEFASFVHDDVFGDQQFAF